MPTAFPMNYWSLATLVVMFAYSDICHAQEPSRRDEVSWVNPREFESDRLTHNVLDSEALGCEVGYVVSTPVGFQAETDQKYPVIYFLHGMGGNESADAAGFSEIVARGIEANRLPSAIVVFPNGGRSGYRGAVETMITQELVPTIDARYPTIAKRQSRVVVGFSMGGQGATRLSLLHPKLFSVAGSWGGGLRRGADEVYAAAEANRDYLETHGYSAMLVNGDQDRPEAFRPLAKLTESWDVGIQLVTLPDTPHKLGRYYELHGEKMVQFLGQALRRE